MEGDYADKERNCVHLSIFAERPRSPAPDRWRDECRERSELALGVPAGRCSVDPMVQFILGVFFAERKPNRYRHGLGTSKPFPEGETYCHDLS